MLYNIRPNFIDKFFANLPRTSWKREEKTVRQGSVIRIFDNNGA